MPHQKGVTSDGKPGGTPVSPKIVASNQMALDTLPPDGTEVLPSEGVFPSPTKPDWHIVDVRADKRGVNGAHRLRHTFRTSLADLGATSDQVRLLVGHSLGGDVSRDYITVPSLVDSLRPVINAVAGRYPTILAQPLSSKGSP